ncbi:hypothetical protein DPMN_005840 [Dreissena polymorpha]|uniref:Uncharacterized protein n=1 Tax=Dreissena polymorpha TaxID=45954 RepID=A0A9D4MQZ7_DREPO|nr:hypothetical protein DPMN_005840 [Dreissena polymorpha]
MSVTEARRYSTRNESKSRNNRNDSFRSVSALFDSQPEVNQNSDSALNNIHEASISAQLLSFSKHYKPPR